ncbi:PorV/PorQ family protein [bacterium]|nr:PorV/PorQ family protein [bacterium]
MKFVGVKCRIFLLLVIFSAGLYAQDGVGLPFLKIGVGARQAGMANVFSGVGDDIYTLYWNPGGLGHLRRWQWSLAYNKWIADVYQASFSFGKQFRLLGSQKTGIGLTCSYLGMPVFDSTGGQAAGVSANHLVAGFALGQRLDWIHPTIAIGAQAKVIQSHLADYSATAVAADAGVLYKSPRFELPRLFRYGMISAGFSVANWGEGMTFIEETTLLPRTYRGGLSFMMGTYRDWQVLLASDWSKVTGDLSQWAVATEVWWMNLLGARAGYRWNEEDLGDFSVGLGFRWDDVMNNLLNLPSRFGDAFSIDLAAVDYGQVLQQTYRGAISHYPLAPEPFRLEEPKELDQETVHTGWMKLVWERAYDPDPFDDVRYHLVVDKLRSRVDQSVRLIEHDYSAFTRSGLRDSLLISESLADTSYLMAVHPGDVFYWAVAAYDLANHAQLAKRGKEKIGTILVPTADLLVSRFTFNPISLISTTPEQGVLMITVANQGDKPAPRFRCSVMDRYVHPEQLWPRDSLLASVNVSGLGAGQDTTFFMDWETPDNGPHVIEIMVDADTVVSEFQKYNNLYQDMIFSIPKGRLIVPKMVEVVTTDYDSTDIPVVAEVYFSRNGSKVEKKFITNGVDLPPILTVLSRRLQAHPGAELRIKGHIDAASGETDPNLADERAEAVRNQLIDMGVPPNQLHVITDHPDKVIQISNAHRTPEDAERVMAQNRVVRFETNPETEEALFRPISVAVDTSVKDRIPFQIRIVSPANVDQLFLGSDQIVIHRTGLVSEYQDSIWTDLLWDGSDQNGRLVPRNSWYPYQLSLTDTLGRRFQTALDSVYLQERRTIRRQEVFGAAKFAKIEPVYQFYWDRMLDLVREMAEDSNLTLRFEGHACVIGPEDVNLRLSYQRAQNFTKAFLDRVRQVYPDRYNNIRNRIETPKGYGELQPLTVKLKNEGLVLLGDNNFAVGRYLNRRISILLLRKR